MPFPFPELHNTMQQRAPDMVTTIQSVGVARLAADQFSETEAVASSSSVVGRWACSSLAYSLYLAEAEDEEGDTMWLSVRVRNTISLALPRLHGGGWAGHDNSDRDPRS